MKSLLTILLIISTLTISAQPPKRFDYGLILGGCFNKDKVSISINNRSVFTDYTINNKDSLVRGNFNLVQDAKGIRFNYNGRENSKKAIPFEFILDITIIINQKKNRLSLDLRKGNIILLDYCSQSGDIPETRKLVAEQLQEPYLLL